MHRAGVPAGQREQQPGAQQAVGFTARTKALMNLPSTSPAIAATSSPSAARNVARVLDAVDRASARCRCRRSPAPRAWPRYSSSPSAPATQPTHSSMLLPDRRRHLAAHDHVGDGEAAARLQHAERLAQHAVLVGREVDDAVRDDDVDRVVGQRDVLDLALQELDVGEPALALVLARPAPASRRSCRGRRPCRSGRRARADSSTSMPPPEPRSSTVSPGFSSASAVGLPQPSEARARPLGHLARLRPRRTGWR